MIKASEIKKIQIFGGMKAVVALMEDNFPKEEDKNIVKLWKEALSLARKAMIEQWELTDKYMSEDDT